MEKFINFKELRRAVFGSGDAPGGVNLVDATATFTQSVRPNAIVWDTTTNAGTGGEMYIVDTVTSDTALALTPIGPTASHGTGVPAAASYTIYMPEYKKIVYDTTDGATTAYKLIDSGVDFIALGVKIGDTVFNITDSTQSTVRAVDTKTQLTLADDIMATAENYLIMSNEPNANNKLLRAADIALVENSPAGTTINNSKLVIEYNREGTTDVMNMIYAYSDTGAVGATSAAFAMRNAVQDAVVAAMQTDWSEVVYDFPGKFNVSSTDPNTTNTTWLGSQEYFILGIQA